MKASKLIKYLLTRAPKIPIFLYAIIDYYLIHRDWKTQKKTRLSNKRTK